MGNGNALEIVETDITDLKGEEGGDGFAESLAEAEVFDRFAGLATSDPASGDEEFFGSVVLSERGVNFKAIFDGFDFVSSAASSPDDAVIAGGIDEAVNDCFRLIGGGKHAAIGLGLELDTMFLEPRDGVCGLETVEGSHEVFHASRVILDKFTRVVTIMGDIAAPPSGDANFCENLGSFFEDEDFFDACFSRGDGSEKSGGSTTNYN